MSEHRVIHTTLPEYDGRVEATAQQPTTFSDRMASAGQTGVFGLVLIATVILVPLVILLIVIINLSGSILASIFFEVLGHLLLRAYSSQEGYDLRLMTSVQVGAVGGAIVAIPFNLIYAFIEALVAPKAVASTEEDPATAPLLASEPNRTSLHETARVFNNSIKGSRRNPVNQNLYARQRLAVDPPSKFKIFIALLADFVSGPALGALSGAVGSAVLRKTGHHVMEVANATQAGALGGFILGPLAALIMTSFLALGIGIWASTRSQ
ncbi:hypothetical protein FRB91_006375 [Serendipita sp. 411]|nr:hypothetical protein FRB91_006375 [Serendipita sp. 411]